MNSTEPYASRQILAVLGAVSPIYGVNTVKKVIRELVYQKHIANSQKENKSKQITMNDAKALCENVGDSNLSGAEQLSKLVGVESIEKRVEEKRLSVLSIHSLISTQSTLRFLVLPLPSARLASSNGSALSR